MTATPLPPWIFERVIDGIPCVPTVEAENNMQIYAIAARADLEAENQRLRVFVMQVLKGCLTGRIKSPPIVIEDLEATDLKLISLGDAARAALESKP